MIPAVTLSLAACGEKEKPKAVSEVPKETIPAPAPDAATESAPAPTPAPTPASAPVAKLSADERAAKLGFTKYLPQDTEIVMSFHNGAKAVERVKTGKLWKFIESQSGGLIPGMGGDDMGGEMEENFELPEGGDDAGASLDSGALDFSKPVLITTEGGDSGSEEAPAPGEGSGSALAGAAIGGIIGDAEEEQGEGGMEEMAGPPDPAALLGQEVTIALGKSVGEQTGNLLKLYSRMGYFQMRSLVKAAAAGIKEGDLSELGSSMEDQYGPELLKNLLSDPESGITLMEKLRMPPLYIALRAPEKDRTSAEQQIGSMIGSMLSMDDSFEPVSIEKAGAKFEGVKISGAKVSESLAENREEMEEMLDAATVDKLLAAIAKNDLIVASGVLGEYVVLFVGASVDDLKIAENPGASLLGTDALAFCDAYASKDLALVVHTGKDALDKMSDGVGGLSEIASGIRDGLAGTEDLGDTRDIQALLRIVSDRESALMKMATREAGCTVAFFEEGLKIEAMGGTDSGALDWKTPNKLASLGDSEDVAVFLNASSDVTYDAAMRGYLEAVVETAYAMNRKVADLKIEDEDLAQFSGMSKMFDEKFRTDAVALWDAVSGDFADGIGAESAIVVDLKGSLPTIPGVSQKIVDEAKCPRIAMICPVTDRAKIKNSWGTMNTSITSILGKVSEMTGTEIPMQKPMSSERNGNTTWYFPMPFINDDFVPSVTVGDKWFSASTSKNQALDLIAKADQGGQTRTGMYMAVNFKAMQTYARETLAVLEKGSGELLGDSAPTESDMKKVVALIDTMDDIDKLTVHARREGGAMRTSIHFKTR